MLDLKSLCDEYKIDVRGIIQIGAHKGQETEEFLSLSPDKILMIEAIPHLANDLISAYKNLPDITVISCAISNYNGQTKFNVLSNDGMSSSLLPLKLHAEIYPHIIKTNEIEIECKRLDTLLGEIGEKASDYNFLNIDVQGAEHLVFEGAMNLLPHIKAINIEINCEELYEGCVLEPELTEFLKDNGFEKKTETKPYHPTWGDAFYVRRINENNNSNSVC